SPDPQVKAINLEGDLPYESASQDFILLFNVLYLISNYSKCLNECRRILAPEGRLIGCIPFFFPITPEPHDYQRFSAEKLWQIAEASGFKKIEICCMGAGCFSTTLSLAFPYRILRPVSILLTLAALGLDITAAAVSRSARRTIPAY